MARRHSPADQLPSILCFHSRLRPSFVALPAYAYQRGVPLLPAMGEGEVVAQPAHGIAAVRTTEEATEIVYTSARDYVGADSFDVAFGPNFTMTVLVQVVPPASR
jgi:hypothetical protein